MFRERDIPSIWSGERDCEVPRMAVGGVDVVEYNMAGRQLVIEG
jgi:hypothetical protein